MIEAMDENAGKDLFAFPAVQQQERLQFVIQSLAPLRRYLDPIPRRRFDDLLRHTLEMFPFYAHFKHLTPVEFILLAFIIDLLSDPPPGTSLDHPPYP